MAVEATCPGCGHQSEVPPSYQGKRVRCPDCETPFQIPNVQKTAAEKPALAPPPVHSPTVAEQQSVLSPAPSKKTPSKRMRRPQGQESVPQTRPLQPQIQPLGEDDYADDRPHFRARSGTPIGTWIGVGGVLVAAGLVIFAIMIVKDRKAKKKPESKTTQVVKNTEKPAPKPTPKPGKKPGDLLKEDAPGSNVPKNEDEGDEGNEPDKPTPPQPKPPVKPDNSPLPPQPKPPVPKPNGNENPPPVPKPDGNENPPIDKQAPMPEKNGNDNPPPMPKPKADPKPVNNPKPNQPPVDAPPIPVYVGGPQTIFTITLPRPAIQGEVELSLSGLPKGVTSEKVIVAKDDTQGVLKILAAGDVMPQKKQVMLVAKTSAGVLQKPRMLVVQKPAPNLQGNVPIPNGPPPMPPDQPKNP